jgi:hypothetical protein
MICSDALVMQLREDDGMMTGRYSTENICKLLSGEPLSRNGRTMICSDALVMQLREEDGMMTGRYSTENICKLLSGNPCEMNVTL